MCLCWCCLQFQPLVKHADTVLNLSKRIVGSTLVNFGVKHTFFAHFCAGEPCMPLIEKACQILPVLCCGNLLLVL